MNICICYHKYPPIIGGVELCIQKLSEFLINRGHQVTVVCSDSNQKSALVGNEEIVDGVRIIYVKSYFELMKVPFAPAYKKTLSTLKPDIIHAYGSMPGYSDVAIIYAKKHHIPSLLTYQFDGNSETPLGNLCAWIYNHTVNKMVVNSADKIISTGKSYAETSPVLKTVSQKVTIVPNGIDLNTFSPDKKKADTRSKYHLPEGKIILWVGRFVKYKGLEYLLKAMVDVPDATLVVVGSGKLESSLKAIVKQYHLESKVKFIGYVKNVDLPELYCLCDFYILSSITRGENFGISILEAMACGKPVIVSDLPGVRDLVTPDVGFRIPPKDTKQLSQKNNLPFSPKESAPKNGPSRAQKSPRFYLGQHLRKSLKDVSAIIKSKICN